ncbi:hypothetical protein CBR_g50035 [Chara braunii]|uniref:Uncharacterized protein n=1 Tax=Chara braunii TaxID=69332 RepID=A0A388M607_CHABU|nr:hypothetical protein CBR_g50035 [Chara braunii]|eukprot:GBG89945.1 hypothetical protein CBR_g50035 [Chara braunii]
MAWPARGRVFVGELRIEFPRKTETRHSRTRKGPTKTIGGKEIENSDNLGTSNCCVALNRGPDKIEIVPNDLGKRLTPSYVAFSDEQCLVGDAAKKYGLKYPDRCVFEVKRLIGRSFHDCNVQQDSKMWPFQVLAGPKSEVLIGVQKGAKTGADDGQAQRSTFTPEEISAILLRRMKKFAEDYAGGLTIRDAVITVPAYFNDSQRQATRDAGERAGLRVLRLMSEPTAAALAYGQQNLIGKGSFDRKIRGGLEKKILVFDLGGGTFDVSLITVKAGPSGEAQFLVNAVAGDGHLGGADFDSRVLAHVAEEFARQCGEDITRKPKVMAKLRSAVIEAKHALSSQLEIDIDLDYGDQTPSTKIGRATFEMLNRELFEECMEIVLRALRAAGVSKDEITEVVLAGGSTRIPIVQDKLTALFGKPPLKAIHPDEAVAYGAAVQAGLLLAISDKCDEGAAVAGSNPPPPKVSIQDVTPLSIGTDSDMDMMAVLIRRNTPIPAKGKAQFFCSMDYQPAMQFKLFEGERALCSANRYLGEFTLTGFTPVPASGKPVAQLLLTIDEDGILHATAEATDNHRELGMTQGVTIQTGKGTLIKDDAHAVAAATGGGSAMAANTAQDEAEDKAIRAAYDSRKRLRELAWAIRQQYHSACYLLCSQRAQQILNAMPRETKLLPQSEYERMIYELQMIRGR